jgi:hypothetical protein
MISACIVTFVAGRGYCIVLYCIVTFVAGRGYCDAIVVICVMLNEDALKLST